MIYVSKFNDFYPIGCYEVVFRKKSKFVYRIGSNSHSLFIRLSNWNDIMIKSETEFPKVMDSFKAKLYI